MASKGSGGQFLVLPLTEEQREAIARFLNIPSVPRNLILPPDLDVEPSVRNIGSQVGHIAAACGDVVIGYGCTSQD